MSKLQSALAWAARGFRVFPLRENTKDQPIFDKPYERATTDAATIARWWQDDITGHVRDYNIGVDTTDLCVIDLDMKDGKDGVASYVGLGCDFPMLTVRTHSGGFHLYTVPSAPVANSREQIGPGIDARGHHGYVLAPGSSIDGREYAVHSDGPVTPTPAAIFERCQAPGQRSAGTSIVELDTAAILSQAKAFVAGVAGVALGGRNDTAFKYAAYLRDLGVSGPVAKDLMLDWAARCEPPLGAEMLGACVQNAYNYAQNVAGAKAPGQFFAAVDMPDPDDYGVSETPVGVRSVSSISPTFGNLLALASLAPRPWLLRRMLLAGETTLIIGQGGTGKSTMIYSMAVHLALGAHFWSFQNAHVGRAAGSVIYNAEDSIEEMSMSLHAICQVHGVDPVVVAPWIMLISGRTHRKLTIAYRDDKGRPAYNADDGKWLTQMCSQQNVVMCALDPLTKLHTLNGNDNNEMSFVMEGITAIGGLSGTAMLVAHHIAKPPFASSGNYAGNADSSLGAGQIKDSARVCFTLAGPTDEDCRRYGLDSPEAKARHLRLDDAKMNRTLIGGRPVWIEKRTHRLWTGEDMGVFVQADMQDKLDEQRTDVGAALDVELRARGAGSMTVAEATLALQQTDPMWQLMTPAIARSRLERLVVLPIELATGDRLKLTMSGAQKRIAYANE